MKVKIFHPNIHGKIEFTCEELEKLLNEMYEEGRRDSERLPWTGPYVYSTPVYRDSLTGTSDKITLTTSDKTIQEPAAENKTKESPSYTVKINGNANPAEVSRAIQKIVGSYSGPFSNEATPTNDPFNNLRKELGL
jgi:hypothetical protein